MKKNKKQKGANGLSERHIDQLIGIQMTEQVVRPKNVYNRKKERKIRVNEVVEWFDED